MTNLREVDANSLRGALDAQMSELRKQVETQIRSLEAELRQTVETGLALGHDLPTMQTLLTVHALTIEVSGERCTERLWAANSLITRAMGKLPTGHVRVFVFAIPMAEK